MTTKEKNKAVKKVNEALRALPIYHDGIPITEMDAILAKNGFNETEPAIYTGRKGESNEHVGFGVYLHFTWYKMDVTGRYEIVSRVS